MAKIDIDEYASNLCNSHSLAIAKEENLNPKFVKGFMDVEFDPFVVAMQGDEGWKIYPCCGFTYVWLDNRILSDIEEWIDSMQEDYAAYISAEVEEIDRELAQ